MLIDLSDDGLDYEGVHFPRTVPPIELSLWDLGGSASYRRSWALHAERADGVFYLFDEASPLEAAVSSLVALASFLSHAALRAVPFAVVFNRTAGAPPARHSELLLAALRRIFLAPPLNSPGSDVRFERIDELFSDAERSRADEAEAFSEPPAERVPSAAAPLLHRWCAELARNAGGGDQPKDIMQRLGFAQPGRASPARDLDFTPGPEQAAPTLGRISALRRSHRYVVLRDDCRFPGATPLAASDALLWLLTERTAARAARR